MGHLRSLTNDGIIPAQQFGNDKSISTRSVEYAARVSNLSQDNNDFSRTLIESGTSGDVHGLFMLPPRRNYAPIALAPDNAPVQDRDCPAWVHSAPFTFREGAALPVAPGPISSQVGPTSNRKTKAIPLGNHGDEDNRFAEINPFLSPFGAYPKGVPGILTQTMHERTQQEFAVPAGGWLASASRGGDPGIGTPVYDPTGSGELNEDVKARLQTALHVFKLPKERGLTQLAKLEHTYGLAWELGSTPLDGLTGFGLCVGPGGGNVGQPIEGDGTQSAYGGVTGFYDGDDPEVARQNQNRPDLTTHERPVTERSGVEPQGANSPGTNSRLGALAVSTHGGPFEVGGRGEKHELAPGVNSMHIPTWALFRGSGADAGLEFQNILYEPPEPAPILYKAHLRPDRASVHEHHYGDGVRFVPELWRWLAEGEVGGFGGGGGGGKITPPYCPENPGRRVPPRLDGGGKKTGEGVGENGRSRGRPVGRGVGGSGVGGNGSGTFTGSGKGDRDLGWAETGTAGRTCIILTSSQQEEPVGIFPSLENYGEEEKSYFRDGPKWVNGISEDLGYGQGLYPERVEKDDNRRFRNTLRGRPPAGWPGVFQPTQGKPESVPTDGELKKVSPGFDRLKIKDLNQEAGANKIPGKRNFSYASLDFAVPGLLMRPQDETVTGPNLRNDRSPDQLAINSRDRYTPMTSYIIPYAQMDGPFKFNFTKTPCHTQWPGGTADGGIIYGPPEYNYNDVKTKTTAQILEDIKKNNVSQQMHFYYPTSGYALARPGLEYKDGIKIIDGWSTSLSPGTNRLLNIPYDSTGTLDDTAVNRSWGQHEWQHSLSGFKTTLSTAGERFTVHGSAGDDIVLRAGNYTIQQPVFTDSDPADNELGDVSLHKDTSGVGTSYYLKGYIDGALQILGGATAGKHWDISVIDTSDTPYPASANEFIIVDASSGPITINTPGTPSDGDHFAVKIKDATYDTTIDGDTIEIDGSTTAVLSDQWEQVTLVYSSSEDSWFTGE